MVLSSLQSRSTAPSGREGASVPSALRRNTTSDGDSTLLRHPRCRRLSWKDQMSSARLSTADSGEVLGKSLSDPGRRLSPHPRDPEPPQTITTTPGTTTAAAAEVEATIAAAADPPSTSTSTTISCHFGTACKSREVTIVIWLLAVSDPAFPELHCDQFRQTFAGVALVVFDFPGVQ
mmetsp:Transcript_20124/g.43897  ORF Transcript_20124/g.43897 Transcript_20124/m.43897 type:complete len:177 (-) Transcript_20124:775-1305(-)